MKQGTEFELLTAELFKQLSRNSEYESVEHDVLLDGHDGRRQIDVLLTGKVGPFDVKTIIECKDFKKNVNITAVDALHSKMLDVNAQKTVLVARKGFSKKAIKKAQRLGISLCTAHSASSEKWKFNLQLPLVITDYSCEKYTPSAIFRAISDSVNIHNFLRINNIPINKIVADYWNNNEIECNDGMNEHIFYPNIKKPHWVYVPDGRKMELHDLHVKMYIKKSYYFGYINNLESAKYLQFYEQDRRHVIFDPNDLSNYRETLVNFSRVKEIPQIENTLFINVKFVHNPDAEMKFAEQPPGADGS